jgi:hypothetical protein
MGIEFPPYKFEKDHPRFRNLGGSRYLTYRRSGEYIGIVFADNTFPDYEKWRVILPNGYQPISNFHSRDAAFSMLLARDSKQNAKNSEWDFYHYYPHPGCRTKNLPRYKKITMNYGALAGIAYVNLTQSRDDHAEFKYMLRSTDDKKFFAKFPDAHNFGQWLFFKTHDEIAIALLSGNKITHTVSLDKLRLRGIAE